MNKQEIDKKKEEELEEETQWDLRKIAIGIGVFALFIGGFIAYKDTLFPSWNAYFQREQRSLEEVRGLSIENYSKEAISSDLEERLDVLKDEVNNLNPAEVATSSPQFQKLINDIKALEQYPRNQAKEFCLRICEGL